MFLNEKISLRLVYSCSHLELRELFLEIAICGVLSTVSLPEAIHYLGFRVCQFSRRDLQQPTSSPNTRLQAWVTAVE